MIEGFEDVVKEWTSPKLKHGCCNTVTIHPDEELDRWAIQQTITILANADYYYTKAEVDHLLQLVSASGVTREQVEEMIAVAIQDKANQSDLEALSAQVQTNTERILNTYTKPEVNALLSSYYTKIQTNSMFGNYSKVQDTTLILNAENITL
jgi:uncharacterized membrane protein YheB (UPF0754 family)